MFVNMCKYNSLYMYLFVQASHLGKNYNSPFKVTQAKSFKPVRLCLATSLWTFFKKSKTKGQPEISIFSCVPYVFCAGALYSQLV